MQFNGFSLVNDEIVIVDPTLITALDGTSTGTTTPGQSEPRSDGNEEGAAHFPQTSRSGA